MKRIQAVVIGAGQAGLAMSHCLTDYGIDNVILERGRVGERWHSERWDSLRLLTPNWMSRLPGLGYQGSDPDGYMTMLEVRTLLENYARGAPIQTGTAVRAVDRIGSGYRITSDRGIWHAEIVVIATGHCDVPSMPRMARDVPASVLQITPSDYRNPNSLPDAGAVVVGASASGVQIAEELHRSGRSVVLAAGSHTRVPRLHRGRDIMWWMDRAGVLDDAANPAWDRHRTMTEPSLQLAGYPDRRSINLETLQHQGIRVVGRAVAIDDGVMHFKDDLGATMATAQDRLTRLLARLDACATSNDPEADPASSRPLNLALPPSSIDFAGERIGTVIWATGYKRKYDWLRIPVLDAAGEIIHSGGVSSSPGLYVMGLRFMRRRKSSFLDGVGADAAELAQQIHHRLTRPLAA